MDKLIDGQLCQGPPIVPEVEVVKTVEASAVTDLVVECQQPPLRAQSMELRGPP